VADDINFEVQRTLGRLEGGQEQILDELKRLRVDFNGHVEADDKRFGRIDADRNKAKGAGWAILGIFSACITFVGSAVLAVFEGWVKFH